MSVLSGSGRGTCLVFGPSNAGKTTLLCALNEVGGIPAEGGPRVHVEFDQDSQGRELTSYWYDILLKKRPPASSDTNMFYHASVTVDLPSWSRPYRYQKDLAFHDGPGGALFPRKDGTFNTDAAMEQFRRQLVAAGQEAETLVLVIGAPTRDLRARQREGASHIDVTLLSNLDSALSAMTRKQVVPRVGLRTFVRAFGRPMRWLRDVYRRRPVQMPGSVPPRPLSCKRFLLLINKVDQLCVDATTDRHMRLDDLARNIDPVGQACALLGASTLRKIAQRISDDATFAVGLMSATGFDMETGRPFFDHTGARHDADVLVSPEEMLTRMRPFGLVDALAFMVTGTCGGSVAAVPADIRDWDPYYPTEPVDEAVLYERLAIGRHSMGPVGPSHQAGSP